MEQFRAGSQRSFWRSLSSSIRNQKHDFLLWLLSYTLIHIIVDFFGWMQTIRQPILIPTLLSVACSAMMIKDGTIESAILNHS